MFLVWCGVVGIVDHFRVNACDAFVCCFFSISKHRVLQHFPCLALWAVMVDLFFAAGQEEKNWPQGCFKQGLCAQSYCKDLML